VALVTASASASAYANAAAAAVGVGDIAYEGKSQGVEELLRLNLPEQIPVLVL